MHQVIQVGERLRRVRSPSGAGRGLGGTEPARFRGRSSGPRTRQSPRRSAPGDVQRRLSIRACRPKNGRLCDGRTSVSRRNGGPQLGQRGQIAGEGIAVGLVRLDADVGRDPGQYLVAGDQHPDLGAIEAGELRRMAFADDDPPLPPADLDRHPVGKPLEARRHRRDAAAIAVLPLAEQLGRRLVEPGANARNCAATGRNPRRRGSSPGRTTIPSR